MYFVKIPYRLGTTKILKNFENYMKFYVSIPHRQGTTLTFTNGLTIKGIWCQSLLGKVQQKYGGFYISRYKCQSLIG